MLPVGTLFTTTTDDGEEAVTIVTEPSECPHCGKLFRVGDSLTMRADGSIKSCCHFPEPTQRT